MTGSIVVECPAQCVRSRDYQQGEPGDVMAANPIPVPTSPLTVEVTETTDQAFVVTCSGRIVSDTTNLLKTRVKSLFPDTRHIRLDLANVTYMDSSGLGALVGLYVSAKSAGVELRLVHLTDRVAELLRMSNLLTIFQGYGEHL
jgi:anti-sigma B factor antagonist